VSVWSKYLLFLFTVLSFSLLLLYIVCLVIFLFYQMCSLGLKVQAGMCIYLYSFIVHHGLCFFLVSSFRLTRPRLLFRAADLLFLSPCCDFFLVLCCAASVIVVDLADPNTLGVVDSDFFFVPQTYLMVWLGK